MILLHGKTRNPSSASLFITFSEKKKGIYFRRYRLKRDRQRERERERERKEGGGGGGERERGREGVDS